MLLNRNLAGKETATEFGLIKFDENGECRDLKPEQEKQLGALPGFEYKEEAKAEPEVKAEEKPAPKKAAAKKTTAAKK